MNPQRLLNVLFAFVAVASFASAECVIRQRAIVTPAVAVAPVAVVAPLAVQVPAYSASYSPPADAAVLDGLRKQIAGLETRVSALEKAVAAQKPDKPAPTPPPPPAPTKPPLPDPFAPNPNPPPAKPPLPDPFAPPAKPPATTAAAKGSIPALFARSCVKCHQQGKKEDGGLAVVDSTGKRIMPLDEKELKAVLRRINLPKDSPKIMPPPRSKQAPATDEEFAEVLDALTRE